jgi:cytochrome b6-f complex iron-sulfur subunit
MPDKPEELEPYERAQDLVEALLRDQRPDRWPNPSERDAETARIASMLNGAAIAPAPRPEFVGALASNLDNLRQAPPKPLWTGLSRRRMLSGVASAVALLVAGGALDRAWGRFGHPAAGPGWVAVARAAALRPGEAIRFLAGDREGYLLNLDGSLSALSAICTHLPCVLQWNVGQRAFVCPCHQAQFSTNGEHQPTANYEHNLPSLPTFAVKQIGGVVYVAPGTAEGDEYFEDYRKP